MTEIWQCVFRPSSGNNRCAARINTRTFAFYIISWTMLF